MSDDLPRLCREVRRLLPDLDPLATGMSARVLRAHVKRCDECRAEVARQQQVVEGLASLREQTVAPPAGLLDSLLRTASRGGVRAKVAVPARGAVSGAKPHLSVGLIVVGAAASTGVGWAAFKGVRSVRRSLRRGA